ncbi:MAG: hypothetical protein EA351_09610 [Gemmatimonadales bacterium]|nr:MAG: hypothetical protein EA351_09610 [Gemmatimonadales bacterium]
MSGVEAGLPGMDDAVRTAFRRLLLSLADSKRILGIRYSDWLLGAPSIEAGIAASSMAQDEWGHARLLYASLKDFGDDPVALEHDRQAAEYASMEALDAPFDDWARVIAGAVVVDGALAVALRAVAEGGYEPIEGRISKMLGEEAFHRSLAEAWFRRLAGSEEGARRLKGAVEEWLAPTLRVLAPDDEGHRVLAAAGLTLPAAELRARLAERVSPLLELLSVEMPEPLGLDDWDEGRGRGPGHPAEEAVERARGDLNRALFVE